MDTLNIEGTYTLQASPEGAWQCMMDEQVLLQALPGAEHVERASENTYAITIHIRQTPFIGSYHGHLTITEQQYLYYYCITVEGEGSQSKINGNGVIHLSGRGENTVIAYKGALHLGKLGTLLPPPVVKGAARLFIQQFFTSLADQLRTMNPPQTVVSEALPGTQAEEIPQIQYTRTALQEQKSSTSKGFPYLVVRLLRLGAGDHQLEEQWVKRLRRIGTAAVLLLLVWVGTRIPRR